MPDHPFLFYQSVAEPVTVPAAAESITLDTWQSQAAPVFVRRRFVPVEGEEIPRVPTPPAESITLDKWDAPDTTTFQRSRGFPVAAVAYAEPLLAIEAAVADGGGTALRSQLRTLVYIANAAPVFVPPFVPETITPDKWQGTDGRVFIREQFLPGSGDEQPRLGTVQAAIPDAWQSHRSAVVFTRPNFAAMGASQHMGGFTTFFVPDISLWDSTHVPVFARRRFLWPEGKEQPRIPTAQESITIDKWDAQDGPVFRRQRFIAVEGEEIPHIPTAAPVVSLDQWQSHRSAVVFNRRGWRVVETEELPRLPTAAAPPPVSLDQWQSHRSAVVFNRYRFAAFIGAQRVAGFTTTHVPELTLWDSPTAARQSFATRRFRTVETEETPRLPTPPIPETILVEKWQSPRVGVPFRRARFLAPEVAESPSIIFAEPIRVDKWQSKFGPIFKKPRFLHGQSTMELIDISLVPFQPALTPPRILTLATTALHSVELSGTITKVLTFAGNTYTLTFSGTDQKLLSFASTGTKNMTVVAETTHNGEMATTPTHEVTIRMGEPPS